MTPNFDDDQQLLYRCFISDRGAWETLIRKFSNLVYQSIHRTFLIKQLSFNQQDLEDLHNTVFLKLFEGECKKLKQYKGENGCSLASWIRVVTVRIVLNHFRTKRLDSVIWKKKQISIEDLNGLALDDMTPLDEVERVEQERLLENSIQNLPPRDRLFMKLYYDQGLSVAEVADAMHLSTQNIYTLKHRAIQKIKTYIASVTKE